VSDEGTTPVDEDEAQHLVAPVSSRAQLNELEQANITIAATRLMERRRSPIQLLREKLLVDVHRQMFSEVWTWAGNYRRTDMSIGIPWATVPVQVRDLLANTLAQIGANDLDPDEIAMRFHHRLVVIHPFRNGNGRHARLFTEELNRSLGRARFNWGERREYLGALRAADSGDFAELRRLVRASANPRAN
jgi:Fic-DOC domain mobile mystery protein B